MKGILEKIKGAQKKSGAKSDSRPLQKIFLVAH
jgi:hypothetical protein